MANKSQNKNTLYAAALFFVLIAVSFMGCSKSSSPGTNEVWMQNIAFTPSTITVSAHSTVKWTNKDGVAHTVTSSNGMFASSGNINSGSTYSVQFNTAGTYPYSCTIHPGMNGVVIVQ